MPRHAFRSSAAVLASLLSLSIPALVAGDVAVPSITGPITGPGSPSLESTTFSLAPFGYVEEEFFATGMASGYVSEVDLSADGKWSVSPRDTAGYTTRLLVRRPTARERFNGTVVVEWLNVSGGLDAAPVPVLTFQTETDVVAVGFFAARQPDGPNIRTWEVAGTAHGDTYLMVVGPTDQGSSARDTTHLPPVHRSSEAPWRATYRSIPDRSTTC